MSMHTWTSNMAAIHLPDTLPSQESYEAFIANHSATVNELFGNLGNDVPAYVDDVESEYENDMGETGIGPLVADIICTESQWAVDYAIDYNTSDRYIGIYAYNDFPWTPKPQLNAGMTPDILENLVSSYVKELWGASEPLDLNVTILFCS